MSNKTIKQELVTFVEMTSLKGGSRIIRSTGYALKYMWAIVVLTTTTYAIYSAVSLILTYYEYPVETFVKEFDILDEDQQAEIQRKYNSTQFPDVTVCNLNYLASTEDQLSPGTLTLQQYYRFFESHFYTADLQELWEESFGTNKTYDEQLLFRLWKVAYYQGYLRTIDPNEAMKLAHKEEVLINSCHYRSFTASGVVTRRCSDAGQVTPVMTSEYFRCFQISPKPSREGETLYQISIVLYLDNFSENMPLYFDSETDIGQENGGAIIIHPHDVYPDFSTERINIPPGFHTQFTLDFSGVIRLSEPYGECTNGNGLTLLDIDGHSLGYHINTCYLGCQQAAVINQCGCILSKSQVILGQWPDGYKNWSYCEKSYFHDAPKTVRNIYCIEKAIQQEMFNCSRVCKKKCVELGHTKTFSTSKWPKTSSLLGFYATLIHNKSYEYRFAQYGEIVGKFYTNNISSEEAKQQLQNLGLIENNFAKVTVILKNSHFLSYEMRPSYTMEVLLSNLGGTLNLYAGITVILMFEILELFVKLMLKAVPVGQNNTFQVSPSSIESERKLKDNSIHLPGIY